MMTQPEKRAQRGRPDQEAAGDAPLPSLPWLIGGTVVLVCLVLADAAIDFTPHFGIDGIFGFHAVYGLASGLLVVIIAKVASVFLKRTDTYYDAD